MAIYRIVLLMRMLGQEMRSVYWFKADDVDAGAPFTAANWLVARWIEHLRPITSSFLSLYGVTIQRIDGVFPVSEVPISPALAGLSAGDPLPTQVAALISFKAYALHPNRARKYIPGMVEVGTTAGVFVASTITGLTNFAASILAYNTNSALIGAWCACNPNDDGQSYVANQLDSYAVNPTPATQRRRRIGVGI